MAEAILKHELDVEAPSLRRFNAGAIAGLGPYLNSLANGEINLISLDAIAVRLGQRWEMRRDAIYDYTPRMLDRHVGDGGSFLRVSDNDYLVARPRERKFAAQARCLRYLREVLRTRDPGVRQRILDNEDDARRDPRGGKGLPPHANDGYPPRSDFRHVCSLAS